MQPLPGHQAGEEEVLHQGALSLVVCPQPMQHSLPVRGLLEEGGAASLPGHQAGEEEVLHQGALILVVCPKPMQHSLPVRGLLEEGIAASLPGNQAGEEEVLHQGALSLVVCPQPRSRLEKERKIINQLEKEWAKKVAEDKEACRGHKTGCVMNKRRKERMKMGKKLKAQLPSIQPEVQQKLVRPPSLHPTLLHISLTPSFFPSQALVSLKPPSMSFSSYIPPPPWTNLQNSCPPRSTPSLE